MDAKLPHGSQAIISLRKLTEYLLSESHPVGGSKAAFFRSYGFTEANVGLLENGLRMIAREKSIVEVVSSAHGTKYVIDGRLETPLGGSATVRTIWIIDRGQEVPRFVTAYPQ